MWKLSCNRRGFRDSPPVRFGLCRGKPPNQIYGHEGWRGDHVGGQDARNRALVYSQTQFGTEYPAGVRKVAQRPAKEESFNVVPSSAPSDAFGLPDQSIPEGP